MTREKTGYELGQRLAAKLAKVTDKETIKTTSIKAYKELQSLVPSGSFRVAFTHARKAIKEVFPDSQDEQPSYYWTNSGKGQVERYEHLVLYYFTTKHERWLETEQEPEQQPELEQQTEQQPEQSAQITLDDMNISQLQLDSETQQMVESAIAHSGMSLADFVRRACQVYAKTVTGKLGQYESDLTAVPTEDLLSSPTYKTHPGRAEELTKRAIYALETHNNNCTEKSQKWMITQTAIQALTGSKPATIKAILLKYKTPVDDHNIKHELNPYDNRKPGRKIDDEINLAALVPDGFYDSVNVNAAKKSAAMPKKEDIHKMSHTASTIEIQDYLGGHPGKYVQISHESKTRTYARVNDEQGFMKAIEVLETGEIIE